MDNNARSTRYRIDFVSNPAFMELMERLTSQVGKELQTLRSAGRGESEHKFSHQSGVVDGVERALVTMRQYAAEAREDSDASPRTDA